MFSVISVPFLIKKETKSNAIVIRQTWPLDIYSYVPPPLFYGISVLNTIIVPSSRSLRFWFWRLGMEIGAFVFWKGSPGDFDMHALLRMNA